MVKQKYVAIQVYPETKERFQQIEGPLGSSQNSIMERVLDVWDEATKGKRFVGYHLVSRKIYATPEEAMGDLNSPEALESPETFFKIEEMWEDIEAEKKGAGK